MDGANQDPLGRNFHALLDEPPRLIAHDAVDAQQIADHEGQPGLAVVDHQAPRVQLIVNMPSGKGHEAADDISAQGGVMLLVAAPA